MNKTLPLKTYDRSGVTTQIRYGKRVTTLPRYEGSGKVDVHESCDLLFLYIDNGSSRDIRVDPQGLYDWATELQTLAKLHGAEPPSILDRTLAYVSTRFGRNGTLNLTTKE